ncbi:MAG: hypothetical protein Q9165_007386 [Trypethelium subeluteriae]
MSAKDFTPLKGYCTCRTIMYEVLAPFIFTNCCHCTWCQRETGAAFILNAIVESSNFRITSPTKPLHIDTATASGDVQTKAHCPKCHVVLYTDPYGGGTWITYVRAGTLDDESKKAARPGAHIFTSTKLDWIDLTGKKEMGIPVFEERYRRRELWSKDANERFDALVQKMDAANKAEQEANG